jgi:polysaccharide export outer membrane protein
MKQIFTLIATLLMLPLWAGMTHAQENYQIKSGDVLRIEVLEDPNLNRSVLVTPDGQFSLPLAGSIRASGRSVNQVRSDVTERLGPNFANAPTVFVSIERLAPKLYTDPTIPTGPTITVYVLGEVKNPGKFQVDPGITIWQFLAEIGGLTKFAAVKRVQVRRTETSGKESVYNLNFKDILEGKTSVGTATLATGDVIIVPQRKLFE